VSGRYVHTIWCDDIRQEIGNKPSFMGVYTGKMVVAELPAVLPRLGVFTIVSTSLDEPFKSMKLRVVRDDGTVLLEILPDPEAIAAPTDKSSVPDATRQTFSAGFALSPLELPAGCRYFEVQVDIDGQTLGGPKLRLEINPEAIAKHNQPRPAVPGGTGVSA
jgi:hypothetical protein